MTTIDWDTLIDAARAENAHGVTMKGGRRYTTVAVRVELLRRHAGGLSVQTEILRWAPERGSPIVVRATISDETGRVLATGHAEEIRGAGHVNATSALENAETSAIGRALAALGISGGEFASANELDGVERKTAALEQANRPAGGTAGTIDVSARQIRAGIAASTTLDELRALRDSRADTLREIRRVDRAAFEELSREFVARASELAETAATTTQPGDEHNNDDDAPPF